MRDGGTHLPAQQRLAAEGLLLDELDVEDAARLLWSTTSQRSWTDLVVDSGWRTQQWTEQLTQLLERALTGTTD